MPDAIRNEDESRLRAVLDTAVDGMILIDAQGVVQMFNPACEKLFGYAASQVIGQNVKMLMPAPYREEHDRYLANYRETGERKIIGIGREVTGQRRDGSTFPMDLSVGEALRDGQSTFVGIIHDLSERKRNEQEVREVAARLRAVVDTAVDGVILIDARGVVLMFNPACEKLFGYAASQVIGQNVRLLMPAPYRDEHDRYLENYRETGERKIIGIGREVVGRRKDGATFPMDLSVGEARQAGQSIFVGVIHDLTERKRTEEQLVQAQKMESVGQLSGGIAHDFNNLLTVIIGNSEALSLRLSARQDLRALSESILSAAERGAELTQRLLAFSRRQVLATREIDCNRLVEEMSRMLQRMLREDIGVQLSLAGDLTAAMADPVQLESALLNLALNAQDAMPNGGQLFLSTANAVLEEHEFGPGATAEPGPYVMVCVTDDGEGMPADVLGRVFEPFFTTKEVGKGSGLGLSMVYGFAKQSNGHVSIYSEAGLGTSVRLYLPAVGTPAAAVAPPHASPPALPGGNELVLVVEDDPFVRGYAVSSLESLGYRVLIAADGAEALALLRAGQRPDLLFTDIVMPGGLSGWGLADQALALTPGMKVLFTSGYPMDSLKQPAHTRAPGALLGKPYRKADLARSLREALSD